jgi:hypothetical protein
MGGRTDHRGDESVVVLDEHQRTDWRGGSGSRERRRDDAATTKMSVEEAQNAVFEKMQRERPTLREYLRSRASGEAKSHKEWAESGNKEQAAYRAGASNAYLEIESMLKRGGLRQET